MLPTAKIINDPVHGFIRIPEGRILKALSHPVVQRLRRLTQLGLAQFVYPGAVHTRFAHALGVMHLADEALASLSRKGLLLSKESWESVLLAALLHDIGHGPFSHSLEGQLLPFSHEELGFRLLSLLAEEVGELSEIQALWKGSHPHPFLSELIASQLDVDRLDYLVRDSFFTGVQEGLIGTERLIYTMTLADSHLAVEEKGLNSVEKFIVARRFMYSQVYLHKGVLGSELLLKRWWAALHISEELPVLLQRLQSSDEREAVETFLHIDEAQIWSWISEKESAGFPPLRALSRALLWRIPYKIHFTSDPETINFLKMKWEAELPPRAYPWREWFWVEGEAESLAYLPSREEEILILLKNGSALPLAQVSPWLQSLSRPMKKPFGGGIPAASLESLLQ